MLSLKSEETKARILTSKLRGRQGLPVEEDSVSDEADEADDFIFSTAFRAA